MERYKPNARQQINDNRLPFGESPPFRPAHNAIPPKNNAKADTIWQVRSIQLVETICLSGCIICKTNIKAEPTKRIRKDMSKYVNKREHQFVLQPVELQIGERLSCQRGLKKSAAALQLLRREVGRETVDQPDALGVWRGSLAGDAGDFCINCR